MTSWYCVTEARHYSGQRRSSIVEPKISNH
jgi:hypothetical protein